MKLEDINNIDFKTAGSLPLMVQLGIHAVIFVVVLILGYWFIWNPAIEELDQAKAKEEELRTIFLDKKRQSINLALYKEQMVEIEKTFGALLRQLPDKSQMDALLTDINQAGLSRGLEFDLFKPANEIIGEFYAEMPIAIKVIGSYNDLGGFATDISKLSRIVTLNNIHVKKFDPKIIQNEGKSLKNANDNKSGLLEMEAEAKTYRYLDSSEIANNKKKELKKPNK